MAIFIRMNGSISEYLFGMDLGTDAHILLTKAFDMGFDVGMFL